MTILLSPDRRELSPCDSCTGGWFIGDASGCRSCHDTCLLFKMFAGNEGKRAAEAAIKRVFGEPQ